MKGTVQNLLHLKPIKLVITFKFIIWMDISFMKNSMKVELPRGGELGLDLDGG